MSETINTSNTVEATHELDHLANKIKVQLEKSDNLYISAGQLIKEAKAKCKEHGLKFEAWLKEHGIGRSKAYVCLAIADGRKTVDEVRKEAADRQKAQAERNRKARKATNGEADDAPAEEIEEEEPMSPEHVAMVKALTKFIKVASPEALAKLCKAAKIKVEVA